MTSPSNNKVCPSWAVNLPQDDFELVKVMLASFAKDAVIRHQMSPGYVSQIQLTAIQFIERAGKSPWRWRDDDFRHVFDSLRVEGMTPKSIETQLHRLKSFLRSIVPFDSDDLLFSQRNELETSLMALVAFSGTHDRIARPAVPVIFPRIERVRNTLVSLISNRNANMSAADVLQLKIDFALTEALRTSGFRVPELMYMHTDSIQILSAPVKAILGRVVIPATSGWLKHQGRKVELPITSEELVDIFSNYLNAIRPHVLKHARSDATEFWIDSCGTPTTGEKLRVRFNRYVTMAGLKRNDLSLSDYRRAVHWRMCNPRGRDPDQPDFVCARPRGGSLRS